MKKRSISKYQEKLYKNSMSHLVKILASFQICLGFFFFSPKINAGVLSNLFDARPEYVKFVGKLGINIENIVKECGVERESILTNFLKACKDFNNKKKQFNNILTSLISATNTQDYTNCNCKQFLENALGLFYLDDVKTFYFKKNAFGLVLGMTTTDLERGEKKQYITRFFRDLGYKVEVQNSGWYSARLNTSEEPPISNGELHQLIAANLNKQTSTNPTTYGPVISSELYKISQVCTRFKITSNVDEKLRLFKQIISYAKNRCIENPAFNKELAKSGIVCYMKDGKEWFFINPSCLCKTLGTTRHCLMNNYLKGFSTENFKTDEVGYFNSITGMIGFDWKQWLEVM